MFCNSLFYLTITRLSSF